MTDKQRTREGVFLLSVSAFILAGDVFMLIAFGADYVIPGRGPVGAWVAGTAAIAVAAGAVGAFRLFGGRGT